MAGKLEAYVLTNGRSTFHYAVKALEAQTKKIRIHVVEDMGMADAMNSIIRTAKSEYILKVDDDFLLHPYAIEYISGRLSEDPGDTGLWFWRLWETFTRRIVQCIKVYHVGRSREMGGFVPNATGKIDRNFLSAVDKSGYTVKKEKSMIALHACAPWKEQVGYERIWSQFSEQDHIKSSDKRGKMKMYKTSVAKQYDSIRPWLDKYNKVYKTSFAKFTMERDKRK